jgi:hypothetical protein
MITIQNSERTKKVTITRTKLSDGYNYYLNVFVLNGYNHFIVSDKYKQKESILSKRKAIEVAEQLIN